MRLKFKALSPISYAKELDNMGVSKESRLKRLDVGQFPQVIHEDFIEPWGEYLRTEVAKSIHSFGNNATESTYLVAVSFISHLLNITSQPFRPNLRYSPNETSVNRLKQLVKSDSGAIVEWLKRKAMPKHVAPKSVQVKMLDFKKDLLTNAVFDPTVQVTVILKPKKTYSMVRSDIGSKLVKNHMDAVLDNLSGYLYQGQLPKQLAPVRRNLENGKQKAKYIEPNRVLGYPDNLWAMLDKSGNIPIYGHRLGAYEIAIRFTLKLPILLFSSPLSLKTLEGQITELVRNSLPI